MDSNDFIKKYDVFIRGFAHKFCRYPEDEKDFAQELRIRLWRAYEEHYDPNKGKLSTWVYQTLLLHARKLRFDMKKQDIFNKEMLNSEYYNGQHFHKDTYFLYLANFLGEQKAEAEFKYPLFEHEVICSLSPEERRVYLLLVRYPSGAKLSRIAKELKIKKEVVEAIYDSIRDKVLEAYTKVYCT